MERPPFFYAADVAHPVWDLTARAADPEGGEELLEIHENDRPQYGIITTQSCDLAEDRVNNPKKPWFQVAPLINAGALPAVWLETSPGGGRQVLVLGAKP